MQPEVKWLMEYLDSMPILSEMDKSIQLAVAWSHYDHGYASKNERIAEWDPTEQDLYTLICNIFIATLMQPDGLTYQAMIGYVANNIRCQDPLDRAKCAAEVIALCHQCELIEITKISSKTMIITTEFELPIQIPDFDKHMPSFKPLPPVAKNSILGNLFKQHALDTCVDHLQRMNDIPLTLEYRVITDIEETTKADLETDEQKDQWAAFKQNSLETYSEVAHHDRFFLEHSYDTRGRCYCNGYYINYQGTSYKKAIVQLANKEAVQL